MAETNKLSNHEIKRLAFINRQPSLWKHSCPIVQLEPTDDEDDETIHVSPLFLEPLNMDCDGDTAAIYIIHDTAALKEAEQKAFLKNIITYDQNTNYLATIRHEALYSAFVLTKEEFNSNKIICKIHNLKDLPENLTLWNESLYDTVQIKDRIFSYGMCLFNKFCGFDDVVINKSITKKSLQIINNCLLKYCKNDTELYYNNLAHLEKSLLFFITLSKYSPSVDIQEMSNVKDKIVNNIFKKLPDNNVLLGFYITESLTNRCITNMDKNSSLYKLFKSGSRFSKSQLARSTILIGYSANTDNTIIQQPINTSLLEGLTEEQYFSVSPATRKSIQDKSKHTPNSGYLERTLVMALSMIEFDLNDCGTSNGLEFVIMSKDHAETLVGKYYLNESLQIWQELDIETVCSFINKKIKIRSPMTCGNPGFKICQKCFGSKKLTTKYVGIVAGQLITERLTQLTLRTFHESGRATLSTDSEVLKFFEEHLIDIEEIESLDNYNKKLSKETILIFDTCEFPEKLICPQQNPIIRGLKDVQNNKLIFQEDDMTVENQDVIYIVENVKNILKQSQNPEEPVNYYLKLMTSLLEVGKIYSSFVEILFTNMFIVDYENKVFWRYNQSQSPTFKLGDKMMASYISSRIGLLFQPNKKTIERVNLEELDSIDSENLTIYEKIYLGKI